MSLVRKVRSLSSPQGYRCDWPPQAARSRPASVEARSPPTTVGIGLEPRDGDDRVVAGASRNAKIRPLRRRTLCRSSRVGPYRGLVPSLPDELRNWSTLTSVRSMRRGQRHLTDRASVARPSPMPGASGHGDGSVPACAVRKCEREEACDGRVRVEDLGRITRRGRAEAQGDAMWWSVACCARTPPGRRSGREAAPTWAHRRRRLWTAAIVRIDCGSAVSGRHAQAPLVEGRVSVPERRCGTPWVSGLPRVARAQWAQGCRDGDMDQGAEAHRRAGVATGRRSLSANGLLHVVYYERQTAGDLIQHRTSTDGVSWVSLSVWASPLGTGAGHCCA